MRLANQNNGFSPTMMIRQCCSSAHGHTGKWVLFVLASSEVRVHVFRLLSPSLPLALFVRLPLGGWAARVFCVKPPPGPQSPAPFAFCVVSDLTPRFTAPPGAGGWAGSARSTWRPHLRGPVLLVCVGPTHPAPLWRLGGGGHSAGSFPMLLTFLRRRHRRTSRTQPLRRKCGPTNDSFFFLCENESKSTVFMRFWHFA